MKKGKKLQLISITAVLAVILILGILVYFLVSNFLSGNEQNGVLNGVYAFSEEYKYSFNGKGKGRLEMVEGGEKYTYPFQYEIDGDQLFMQFSDHEIADSYFTFYFESDKLILIGGEGTIGGAYEFTKE